MNSSAFAIRAGAALVMIMAICGCGKVNQVDHRDASQARSEAKRQKAVCASPSAYDRLKDALFDNALAQYNGDRRSFDALADYSTVRMESPVVAGRDPDLDITKCAGRFVIDLPPGTERAFGGDRRLQAEVAYSAQTAADGSGLVYRLSGAEPIVARLAGFNLTAGAFRPPPAIDQGTSTVDAAPAAGSFSTDRPDPPRSVAEAPSSRSGETLASQAVRRASPTPARPPQQKDVRVATTIPTDPGEATVRAFYGGLHSGNGTAASAQVIPEKRSSRAYSPEAITRFYGRLKEPLQLTDIRPVDGGTHRVRYRYSTGRSRCDGSAVVRLTPREGQNLIRSIQALRDC